MQPSRFLAATTSLALFLTAAVALADPQVYKLDGNHTQVGFNVRHFFSKVPGQFNKFDGQISLDEKNWANSSVEATIDAASVDTNNEKRDAHLKSADFFEVEKYPTLTFKSTKVTPAGEGKLKVDGDLTIRGVTKPVVLDVDVLGAGQVAIGGNSMSRAGFEAKTRVNRKDFGILWNKNLDQGGTLLGDDVDIVILVEAMKAEPPKAADAKPAATPPATKK
jgi:polyisoprenoid-binding protein YceI